MVNQGSFNCRYFTKSQDKVFPFLVNSMNLKCTVIKVENEITFSLNIKFFQYNLEFNLIFINPFDTFFWITI